MMIFYNYLKKYWKLCVLTLVLAAINQIFSLLDPYIFRHVIDQYATKPELYTQSEFFTGVGLLLLSIVGVAFVSRTAKNFQDYFLNGVSKRVGADLYRDGIAHALALPYESFEDERSGETLGKLQKARDDTEKLMAAAINVLFVSFVGFIFVAVYAINIYWGIAAAFFITVPIIGGMSLLLSNKIKRIQTAIVVVMCGLTIIFNIRQSQNEQHFSFLAQSFLNGKTYFLEMPGTWDDTVVFGDRNYRASGLLSALILVPGVWFWGINNWGLFSQAMIQIPAVIGIWILVWLVARRIGWGRREAVWAAVLFSFLKSFKTDFF
jgi:ABC-type multidrug transport system fused ATPase/permease subunit